MEKGSSKAASSFLAAYYDPGVSVRDFDPSEIEKVERDRLRLLYHVALAASQIPRRLGSDAEGTELSQDKKRCRRIAHVAAQCHTGWGGDITKGTVKDVKKEAAQVVWDKWWEGHSVTLQNRITYIATWGVDKTPLQQRWAKSAIVKLLNELTWLQYAMR